MQTEEFYHDFGAISEDECSVFDVARDLLRSGQYPMGTKIVSVVLFNDNADAVLVEQTSGKRVSGKLSKQIDFPNGSSHLHIKAVGGAINAGEATAEILIEIPTAPNLRKRRLI